ncbi:hypothetical protein ACHAQH_006934 [Verticillium albo-atrum]
MIGDRAQSINLDNIQPSIAANSEYDGHSQSNIEDDENDEPSDIINASSGRNDHGGILGQSQVDDEAIEIQTLVLGDLNHAVVALVAQIFRDQKPRPEVWRRLIAVHRKPFANFRRMYVDESVPFINVQESANLLGEDVQWQAQGIFASANLASLVDEISDPSFNPTTLLQRLDQDFPAPFVPWMDELRQEGVEWNAGEDIFQLALSIRTQRLIFAIENMEQFDIERAVAAIFATEDDGRGPRELLIKENMAAICCLGERPNDAIAATCYERVQIVLETASKGQTPAEIVKLLRERFPVKDWISDQIDWAYDQFQETQRAIQGSLRAAEGTGDSSRSVAGSEGSQAFSQFSQQVIRPQNAVAQLMQLGEAAGVSQNAHGPASSVEVIDGPRSPRHDHNGHMHPPASPASTTGSGAYESAILRQLPLSSREMSSQTRVVDSQPAPPPVSSFQSINSRKRTRDDDVFEDDFEQDDREPDELRRAERDRRAMPPPPPKRSRYDQVPSSSTTVPSFVPSLRRHAVPQSSRDPGPRASFDDNGDDDESTHSVVLTPRSRANRDWRAIQQRNRNQAPSSQRVQHRVPWSNHDVSRLIDLISTLGCSWSEIEQIVNPHINQGPGDEKKTEIYDPSRHFEDRRGQQAIRDKARNLKVDFLK